MRSIFENSHSLLHRGQTDRALSQRCDRRREGGMEGGKGGREGGRKVISDVDLHVHTKKKDTTGA